MDLPWIWMRLFVYSMFQQYSIFKLKLFTITHIYVLESLKLALVILNIFIFVSNRSVFFIEFVSNFEAFKSKILFKTKHNG